MTQAKGKVVSATAVSVPPPGKAELAMVATVTEVVEQANRVAVSNDDEQDRATSLLSLVKQMANKAEAERKSLVGPLNGVVKALNERFGAAFITPLSAAEANIKAKLGGYMHSKRLAAEEVARKERERQEKMEAEGRAKAASNAEARAVVAENVAATATTARGSYGGTASLRDFWRFEIRDFEAIPREWLVIDEAAVNRAIRRADSPIRQLPGLRIYNDPQVAAR